MPFEHHFILPAHQVRIDERQATGLCPALHHGFALHAFAHVKRRRVDHRQKLRTGCLAIQRRAFKPGVFTNQQSYLQAVFTLTCLKHAHLSARLKITPFVENLVVGKLTLGICGHHLAGADDAGAVLPARHCHRPRACLVRRKPAAGVPHHDRHARQICQFGDDALQGLVTGADEGGAQKQVFRCVAANRQFRRKEKAGTIGMGAPCRHNDFLRIAGQVADDKIELGNADFESHKLKKQGLSDYVIRVLRSPAEVNENAWNALLSLQAQANPFMRHEYLCALHASGSAVPATGWTPSFITLWQGDALAAACALYVKPHSYGEYVFDWAWANAYQQHGLDYYPKAVIASPFTPVPGARLLARTQDDRVALLEAAIAWSKQEKLSSLHMLFGDDDDVAASAAIGLMQRHTVQFHWKNVTPTLPTSCGSLPPEGAHFPGGGPAGNSSAGFVDFEAFLSSLTQEKRKKIRQERRKVAQAGVTFRWSRGSGISSADWDFFYRCYERTYLEHGNAPYLTRDFFHRMASSMAEDWLLFIGEQDGLPIASSLIAIDANQVAYGRYWGALKRVDCLHFEACFYQPLQWCIDHGFHRFEGGAQGEHKMARALMPIKTHSAHWLAHPAFAQAVEHFLKREGDGIENYLESLTVRSPYRERPPAGTAPTPALSEMGATSVETMREKRL